MGGLVPCLFYVNVGVAGVGRLGCASWKGGRGGVGGSFSKENCLFSGSR